MTSPSPPTSLDDPRWPALRARDPHADGTFFFGVKTTGVFCRPSCGARAPRSENVAFFATTGEATRAGYRPCKRCKPDEAPLGQRHADTITAICRRLETAEEPPSLETLARGAGLSAFYLHRLFRAATGVTPRAYADAHRANRLRAALAGPGTVTAAFHEAGYGSSGRFYEATPRRLGMTPTSFRAGGVGVEIRTAIGACALGTILVAATDRGLCALLLGDDPEELGRDLARRFPRALRLGPDAAFEGLVARAIALVDHGGDPALPLDIRGTAFQQRVWQALQAIPPGATATYGELARTLGVPGGARAVAGACAANPLAVAVPCHRVVREGGKLGGYRWGLERKRALLDREAGLLSPRPRQRAPRSG